MKKWWLLIAPVVLIIDQVTKIIAMNSLAPNESITIIPNFFWIRYMLNYGVGFSLFEGHAFWFGIFGLVVSVALLVYAFKVKHTVEMIGIALIFAGTLGNVIDRLYFGYVRDMLSFNIFGYMFPIFNVADMALTIGVGFLLLEYIILEKKHER